MKCSRCGKEINEKTHIFGDIVYMICPCGKRNRLFMNFRRKGEEKTVSK